MTRKRHYIFDMDGTIFDTEWPISAITAELAQGKGCHAVTAEEVFRDFSGLGSMDKFKKIGVRHGTHFSEQDLLEMQQGHRDGKDGLYDRDLALIPGVRELIGKLSAEEGALLSLASTNKSARSRTGLAHAGLAGFFGHRVYGPDLTESKKSKPEPDIHVHAIRASGIPARDTVVFEDTNAGITAARRVEEVLGERPVIISYLDPRFGPLGEESVEKKRLAMIADGADLVLRAYNAPLILSLLQPSAESFASMRNKPSL